MKGSARNRTTTANRPARNNLEDHWSKDRYPEVCLVVPCYIEEHRLDVPAFECFLQACPEVSFCFVNDGSRDRTPVRADCPANRA